MTTRERMEKLPALPDLGQPEKNMANFRRRLEEAKSYIGYGLNPEVTPREVTKTIQGEQGWSATLYAWRPGEMYMGASIAYALEDILIPLADWFVDTVSEAVMECPAPPLRTTEEMAETAQAQIWLQNNPLFMRTGVDMVFENGEWEHLTLEMGLEFNGKVRPADIVWPFNPWAVSEQLEEGIRSALGLPRVKKAEQTGIYEWDRLYITPKEPAPGIRFLRNYPQADWATEQPPLITGPAWKDRSNKMSQGVCKGEMCRNGTPEDASDRGRCNREWRRHSEAVFEAFRQANPGLTYLDTASCVLDVGTLPHDCSGSSHRPIRGRAFDHDELCRLEGGGHIIISHPYQRPGETQNRFDEDLPEWQAFIPDIHVLALEPQRSWYFPSHSSLVIVGRREMLDRLNLDYPVPTDTEPTGCLRWLGR